jgi:glucose repression regulatory protein TUP1
MQEIYSLDFSRDGRFLVSGSGDKSARVWDVEKGTCVFDLRIEDFIHNEHGPIDAGITSVARKLPISLYYHLRSELMASVT